MDDRWRKGSRRAAALLSLLGPEVASEVVRHLPEREIERLSLEVLQIERIGHLPEEMREEILDAAYWQAAPMSSVPFGGVEYVRELLSRGLGRQRAEEILLRLQRGEGVIPFEFLTEIDPPQLANFLRDEHPQAVALILTHLPTRRSAQVLSNLPEELQGDVARRITSMGQISPEVLSEVERSLMRKLSPVLGERVETYHGGLDSLVEILKAVDRGTEKTILEFLGQTDPTLAEHVRQKMFVFEDLTLLDDRSVQRVLQEVDSKDLPLALKGAGEEVRELILRNVSSRAREMILEELEAMGPVRLKNVEKAQEKIVQTVRRLEEQEEIFVARGVGDEVVV